MEKYRFYIKDNTIAFVLKPDEYLTSDDCNQSADVFSYPAVRFLAVLFTQCSASRSGNRRYLSRCDSFRYLAATVADLACLSARTSNLAAISA